MQVMESDTYISEKVSLGEEFMQLGLSHLAPQYSRPQQH